VSRAYRTAGFRSTEIPADDRGGQNGDEGTMVWVTLRLVLLVLSLVLLIAAAIGKLPLWPAVLLTIVTLAAMLLKL